jgi:hypothetical protein
MRMNSVNPFLSFRTLSCEVEGPLLRWAAYCLSYSSRSEAACKGLLRRESGVLKRTVQSEATSRTARMLRTRSVQQLRGFLTIRRSSR